MYRVVRRGQMTDWGCLRETTESLPSSRLLRRADMTRKPDLEYFAEREALCTALDEHVRKNYTPCEGQAWQPIAIDV